MTVLEMHTALDLGLDKSASFQTAAFEPEDKDFWLNEAYIQLIKMKVFGNNYRQETLFQGTKHLDDLRPLIEEYVITDEYMSQHSYYPNVYTYDLDYLNSYSKPYMFYIHSTVKSGINDLQDVVLVNSAEASKLFVTKYNTPFLRHVYSYLSDDVINIILDPYSGAIDSVNLTYIRRPKALVRSNPGSYEVTTCELPEQVHPEIVALATSLMLENIADPRYSTFENIINKKE